MITVAVLSTVALLALFEFGFVAGTPVGPHQIERIVAGMHTFTLSDSDPVARAEESAPIDPASYRLLRLHQVRRDGSPPATAWFTIRRTPSTSSRCTCRVTVGTSGSPAT